MEHYRRRLERTQIKICVLLLVLLFGGLLILPPIGQVIWIAIIMAIYLRLIFVIARKEELLEEIDPTRERTRCSAWHESRQHCVGISGSDTNRVLRVDGTQCVETKQMLPRKAALTPHKRATVPHQNQQNKLI
jgi:hypothetical protein